MLDYFRKAEDVLPDGGLDWLSMQSIFENTAFALNFLMLCVSSNKV